MQHTNFAKSTEKVSRLGFGAMGLGGAFGKFDESEGIRSVHLALDKGVNFFDTARHYGRSEEILGKAFEQWGGNRPFIATKIQSHGKGNSRWAIPPLVEEVFPKHRIRLDTEESLRNLKTDCIDLMQLHLYWPTWGTSGYWLDELLQLKEEGKIRYIGVSNPDHRHETVLPLVMSGCIDAVQTIVNIFDPQALDCLVPICEQYKVAVIARCVLDEGGLSGFLKEDTVFEKVDFRKSYFDEIPRKQYIQHINALRKFIPNQAASLASLAIKYVLHHPAVTTAIASMHIEQFANENIEALDEPPLTEEVFYELYTVHRWIKNLYHSKYWSALNDLDNANKESRV
jgi:methylglyoxal reductase